jgi:hypothetical protein
MFVQNFRSKLLLWLFVLSLILLAANIFLKGKLNFSVSKEQDLNVQEINQRFRNVLSDFSIGDNLIKESQTEDKIKGKDIPYIKVKVPEDLTIPEILQDVYQTFIKDSIKFISDEIVKDGKSVLIFTKDKSAILQVEFNYAKKVFRNRGSIAFIVKDIEPGNSTDDGLIESSTIFNLLLRPESKLIQKLNFLKENQKQFSLLIDDDIKEQKYRLAPSFSAKRITTVVQTLAKDFASAVAIIIDENSEFYKSKNRLIFVEELKKRNIKTFNFSDFVNFMNTEDINELFKNEIENLDSNEKKLFLIDKKSFIDISSGIQKAKKKGYKIVESSLLF